MRRSITALATLLIVYFVNTGSAADIKRCQSRFPEACTTLKSIIDCELWNQCIPELRFAVLKPAPESEAGLCLACKNVLLKLSDESWMDSLRNVSVFTALFPTQQLTTELSAIALFVKSTVLMLHAGISSDKVCALLEYCGDTQFRFDRRSNVKPLLYRPFTFADTDKLGFIDTGNRPEVDTCASSIFQLQKAVSDLNSSGLRAVCAILSTDIAANCESIFHQYVPLVVTVINQIDATTLCQSILPTDSDQDARVSDSALCKFCVTIATKARAVLSNQETDVKIQLFLASLCQMLPPSLRSDCTQQISNNLNRLLQFVLNHQPEEICMLEHLCPSRSTSRSNDICSDCTAVMSDAQTLYADLGVQAQIVNTLADACSAVQDEYPNCAIYVKQGLPSLFQAIVQGDSKTMCITAGVCRDATSQVIKNNRLSDGKMCNDCLSFVGDMQVWLADAANQNQFLAMIMTKGCAVVEVGWPQCTEQVQTLYPYALHYVITTQPSVQCNLAAFCPSADTGSV